MRRKLRSNFSFVFASSGQVVRYILVGLRKNPVDLRAEIWGEKIVVGQPRAEFKFINENVIINIASSQLFRILKAFSLFCRKAQRLKLCRL